MKNASAPAQPVEIHHHHRESAPKLPAADPGAQPYALLIVLLAVFAVFLFLFLAGQGVL